MLSRTNHVRPIPASELSNQVKMAAMFNASDHGLECNMRECKSELLVNVLLHTGGVAPVWSVRPLGGNCG